MSFKIWPNCLFRGKGLPDLPERIKGEGRVETRFSEPGLMVAGQPGGGCALCCSARNMSFHCFPSQPRFLSVVSF